MEVRRARTARIPQDPCGGERRDSQWRDHRAQGRRYGAVSAVLPYVSASRGQGRHDRRAGLDIALGRRRGRARRRGRGARSGAARFARDGARFGAVSAVIVLRRGDTESGELLLRGGVDRQPARGPSVAARAAFPRCAFTGTHRPRQVHRASAGATRRTNSRRGRRIGTNGRLAATARVLPPNPRRPARPQQPGTACVAQAARCVADRPAGRSGRRVA